MYSEVMQSSRQVHGKENTKNFAWPESPSRKPTKKWDRKIYMSFVFSLIILEHQFLKNYISVIYWFISCLKSIEIFIARQNLLRKITKTEYSCAGVSISFRTSGYLRVTGGYICRRFDPRRVWGHAPLENFEVLDSRRCIFMHFQVFSCCFVVSFFCS